MAALAVRNTGATLNPATRKGEYSDPEQVIYIARRMADWRSRGTGRPIAITSFGSIGYRVGESLGLNSDNNGLRFMGSYEIVGIVDGTMTGNVPVKALPHYVVK